MKELEHVDASYRVHGGDVELLHGTRVALLKEIEEWATRPATSKDEPIFHLAGALGSGKTTVVCKIAKRLKKKKFPVVTYFYRRGDVTSDCRFFVPTITYRIAASMPCSRPHIVKAARTADHAGLRMDAVLMEALRKLNATADVIHPILVIVDFFDVADDTLVAWVDLMRSMALQAAPIALRFLTTSRRLPRLKEKFSVRKFDLQSISRHVVNTDIALYLKNAVGKSRWRSALLDAYPDALKHLAEMADDYFFLASMSIKFLDADPENVVRNYECLLSVNGGKAVVEPRDLNGLYALVLDNAHYGMMSELDIVRRMLSGITLLQGNLVLGELCSLLSIPPEDALSLLGPLRWFLAYPIDTSIKVRPGHASFVEFLTNPRRCTVERFHIVPPKGHAALAAACLECLNKPGALRKSIRDPRNPSAVVTEGTGDLQARVQTKIQSHVQYACLYWPTHLSKSKHTWRSIENLKTFCTEKILYWLEVLSLLGKLDVASEQLAAVHTWYQVFRKVSLGETL